MFSVRHYLFLEIKQFIFKTFQSLDTDRGEFICPVCRQMANALLPVPPDAQELPPAIIQNSLEMKAVIIQGLLGEETFHMVRIHILT